MYNLKQKSVMDMNGIESYINNKLDTDDITWLPIRRALNLELNENTTENLHSNLESLNTKLEAAMQSVKKMLN